MAVGLPTQFGRYRILKKLGEGGMGGVYLARDTQLDRQIALKVPSFSRHEDSVVLGRFYREARAAAALQHPNICPLFDVGEIDGVPYLTMAYIEGRPLSAWIRAGQRLNERQAAQLVRKVAMALEEAHRRGVIHRDLKPSNIMIDQRREPMIMDFGLARRTDRQDTRLTQSGAILGTPAYMAPEQVLGEPIHEEEADGIVQLLPPAVPEGRLGPRNWAHAAARRLGMGQWRQWWGRCRVPFAAECLGVALLAVVMRVFLPSEDDGRITAQRSAVLGQRSGGSESSKPSEGPSGSAGSSTGGPAPPPLAIAPFDAVQAKQHQQAWADYLGVPVETTNSIGMQLVLIPPGEFDMGCTEEEVERLLREARQFNLSEDYMAVVPWSAPQHRVRISRPFYLGIREVTQAEYLNVMDANPSRFKDSGNNAPVEQVFWKDASAFCGRLSDSPPEQRARAVYRLPTEAEWEYAARAGTTTAWCFGDKEAGLSDYAWWGRNSGGRTHTAGQKKPNAFGLFDVHGNVWEFCADWFAPDYYKTSTLARGSRTDSATRPPLVEDPMGPSGGDARGPARVLRGCDWLGTAPQSFRCAYRPWSPVDTTCSDHVGFRVARTISP